MSLAIASLSAGLRAWQLDALRTLESWEGGPFLISAAPGAGKTRPALELARALLRRRSVSRIAVVCPTTPLTRQWAAAAARAGLSLLPDAAGPRAPSDFDGVAVTYARIAADAHRWARAMAPGTLVVADEAHHLGDELAWGTAFTLAFGPATRWLLLSGTPFRSDAAPIPGVRYDGDGVAEPDVTYTYADAVRDGVCRPVGFITYDGALSWRSGDDVIESSFDTVLPAREASRRYRTAISTELPDGLARILREADQRLSALRAGGHRDAGGLIVAADSAHARQISALLRQVTGHEPVVVLHSDARAAERLETFTDSREPWIVAVNMVSEGVDIPRLRVGVYATAAKTPMIFRQIVGRFVRTLPGRPPDASWLYLPADPVLRRHAADVEGELRSSLRSGSPEFIEDRHEPRRGEPSEQLAFVPLSADVSPQMALFGTPGAPHHLSAATYPVPPPVPSRGPAEADSGVSPHPVAAFQRRAQLRDRRRRLVGELGRSDGRSHREINAWLNREVGVARVQDASIGQLERSIELLHRRLSGSGPRRRGRPLG